MLNTRIAQARAEDHATPESWRLRYNFRRMGKVALTLLDVLMILLLSILGLREFLAFQLGISPYLPNVGQLIGFDAVKVFFIGLCVWGVWYFAKRLRKRFQPT
jgi:hypothetical protein